MSVGVLNEVMVEFAAQADSVSGFSMVSLLMIVAFVALMIVGWRGVGKCPKCDRLFGYWKSGVVKIDREAGVCWGELRCKRCEHVGWKRVRGGGGNSDGGFIFGGDVGDGFDGGGGGGGGDCGGGDGGGA